MGTVIKKIFFVIAFACIIHPQCHAEVLDSLLKILGKEKQDTARVKTLVDIGWEYSYSDVKKTAEYANEALRLSESLSYDEGRAQAYNLLGISARSTAEYEKALTYFKKCLDIRIHNGDTEKEGKLYVNMANVFQDMADYSKAERYYKMALEKAKLVGSSATEIIALTNLAATYQNLADYGKALDCLFHALELNKSKKDPTQDAFIYVNIGLIYQEQLQYKLAEEYDRKGLELFKKLGREDIQANIYNNLGIIYKDQKKYEQALEYYNESMSMYKKVGMEYAGTMLLHNIGSVYAEMKQYDKALQCQSVALSEALKNNDDYYAGTSYMSMAEVYTATGHDKQAEDCAGKGLEMIKRIGDKNELKNCYITLSNVFSSTGNFDKAFYYEKTALELTDSLNNDALNKRIGQMQAMYEADKKQGEIDLLTKDNEIQGERIIRQRMVNYTVAAGLLLVLVMAFISFRRYQEKKKANIEIMLQKDLIEEKNKSILDSIHYARRIQKALLASDNALKKNLPDFFVLYKPKDIVSGDFYWAHHSGSRFLLATCDCTGHGVPGAFMSLLNISKLNETVNERKIIQPDLILNNVRDEIIKALNAGDAEEKSRDGMDAVLCSFDFNNLTLQFAAANNSVIIIRNNDLIEFKPDKFPVGMHQGELKPFTFQSVNLMKGDTIYTFTDGYADQFGGDKGKKMMTKNFKQLLLSVSMLPMNDQRIELEKHFDEWRSNYEQVDDVLVIGVRV